MTKRRDWASTPSAINAIGSMALASALIFGIQDLFGFTFIGNGGAPAYPSGGTVMVSGLVASLAFTVSSCLRYIESKLPPDKPTSDQSPADR